jgi:hypothetical protein
VEIIVTIEGLIAIAVSILTWRCRRSGAVGLCGVLLGMAWAAFLHGFCFGVLQVEGPKATQDLGLLAGFGVVSAVFLGLPVGAILGLILYSLRSRQCG